MRTLDDADTLAPKDRSVLLECKRVIQRFDPEATVLLFGSVARGTAAPDSDYDVLVLTTNRLPMAEQDRIGDTVYDLELKEGVVISLLFWPRDEWSDPLHRAMPLHKDIDAEGIVL